VPLESVLDHVVRRRGDVLIWCGRRYRCVLVRDTNSDELVAPLIAVRVEVRHARQRLV